MFVNQRVTRRRVLNPCKAVCLLAIFAMLASHSLVAAEPPVPVGTVKEIPEPDPRARVKEMTERLERSSRDFEALRLRGNAYMALSEWEKAEADLSRLTQLEPANPRVWSAYGDLQLLRDRRAGTALVCPPGNVTRLFEVVRTNRRVPIFKDLDSAVQSIALGRFARAAGTSRKPSHQGTRTLVHAREATQPPAYV